MFFCHFDQSHMYFNQLEQVDCKSLSKTIIHLREFNSKVTFKYDFALFGIGAFEKF